MRNKDSELIDMNRRQFCKLTLTSLLSHGLLSQYSGSRGLMAKSYSPNDMINIGVIGVGAMGMMNLGAFLNEKDCRVVAVCDVDKDHLAAGLKAICAYYGNQDCKPYNDFREVLSREDIDAVCLSLPDHWHSIPAIEAARAGKDIYGEKPLSHTFLEGQEICRAVERYNRIWQTGSWQRSSHEFRFACELVLNGYIGKVHSVEVGLLQGPYSFDNSMEKFCSPPSTLDYNFWLGPAPYAPYCPARVHGSWRWNLDYGGGQLMDWVGHHVDIAHWALELDHAGPVEVEGYGEYIKGHVWNSAQRYKIQTIYPNKVQMTIAGGYSEIVQGIKWIGEDGWIWVDRGKLDASDKKLLSHQLSPNERHLYRSPGHQRNFLDCVRSRAQTLTPCQVAHRSATPGHLGQISMLLKRKIFFDPETETIQNDETASRMLSKPIRSPWNL